MIAFNSAMDVDTTRQTPADTHLQVGDLVKIAPGTLAWSAETLLRRQIGRVISTLDDEQGRQRVNVEFPRGKFLPRRQASVFQLVERPLDMRAVSAAGSPAAA